ncbi:HIT family protein [Nonomuraea sp. NPDC051941]|uniref:HIT family protein n=1 Tax=Nonomuraea sp. NPDC051941 TaxID=3364373 RepID=UPI0037C59395
MTHQAIESADPPVAIGLALGLHMPFNYRGWVTYLADVHLNAIAVAARCGDWAGQAQAGNYLGRAARAIAAAYDPGGIAVWQNNGAPAHQTVPHVHFHVAGTLPDGGTRWGEVPRLDLDETDGIAKRLSLHL